MNTKRSFKKLSKVEQEALHKLHELKTVCSSGPTGLARRITGNPKLQPSDETTQVYIQLVLEHWIVYDGDRRDNTATYKVSPDYSAALQPA